MARAYVFVRSLMAIGSEQAAIRTAIAGALVENVSESRRAFDALSAMSKPK
jgi:hypothetical protein